MVFRTQNDLEEIVDRLADPHLSVESHGVLATLIRSMEPNHLVSVISQTELAERCGRSTPTIQRHLRRLKKRGLIHALWATPSDIRDFGFGNKWSPLQRGRGYYLYRLNLNHPSLRGLQSSDQISNPPAAAPSSPGGVPLHPQPL